MKKYLLLLLSIIIISCSDEKYTVYGVYDSQLITKNDIQIIPIDFGLIALIKGDIATIYDFDNKNKKWMETAITFELPKNIDKIVSLELGLNLFVINSKRIEKYEYSEKDDIFIKVSEKNFLIDKEQIIRTVGGLDLGIIKKDYIDFYEAGSFKNLPKKRFYYPKNATGFIGFGSLGVIENKKIVFYKYDEKKGWEIDDRYIPFIIPENTDGLVAQIFLTEGTKDFYHAIGIINSGKIEFYTNDIDNKNAKWQLRPELTFDIEHFYKVALFSNNYKEVKNYLDFFDNIDTITNNQGVTPLLYAVTKENFDIIELLLEKGANPNGHSKGEYHKWTPLRAAIILDNTKVVDLLLKHNADINLAYKISNRVSFPIDLSKSTSMINFLVEKGAKTNGNGYYKLGSLFFKEKNYIKALEYYLKASEMGNSNAQNDIGVIYHKGLGVEKDKEKAKEWFKKAKDNGNKQAAKNYKIISNTSNNNYSNNSSSNKQNDCLRSATVIFTGPYTCKIKQNLTVRRSGYDIETTIGIDDPYALIFSPYDECIKGNYSFSWSYYSQCINYGNPDGPYSYSGTFYLDGNYKTYYVDISSSGYVTVTGH